jgi:hypothetical protein
MSSPILTPLIVAAVVFVVTFTAALAVNMRLARRRRVRILAELADAADAAGLRLRAVEDELTALRAFAASRDGDAIKPVMERFEAIAASPRLSLLNLASLSRFDKAGAPKHLAAQLDRLQVMLGADPVWVTHERVALHFASDLERAGREDAALVFDPVSRRAFDANLARLTQVVSGLADEAEALRRDLPAPSQG